MPLTYKEYSVVFQEVPNEVSLSFSIMGCGVRCAGCHSPELWYKKNGKVLTKEFFKSLLAQYGPLVTTVLFFGGEWEPDFVDYLLLSKEAGKKTALYTGKEEEDLPESILKNLDYLKTGRFMPKRGGLSCEGTNQKMINCLTRENLNHYFIKKKD